MGLKKKRTAIKNDVSGKTKKTTTSSSSAKPASKKTKKLSTTNEPKKRTKSNIKAESTTAKRTLKKKTLDKTKKISDKPKKTKTKDGNKVKTPAREISQKTNKNIEELNKEEEEEDIPLMEIQYKQLAEVLQDFESKSKFPFLVDVTPGALVYRFLKYQSCLMIDLLDQKQFLDHEYKRSKLAKSLSEKWFCIHTHDVPLTSVYPTPLFTKEKHIFPEEITQKSWMIQRDNYIQFQREGEKYGTFQDEILMLKESFLLFFLTTNQNLEKIPQSLKDHVVVVKISL